MKHWLLLMLCVCGSVFADEQAAQVPGVDPVSSAYLVKITLGLAFILVLIFVLAWVMKKMHLTPQSNNQMIRVLSAVSVGQRDRIALVEVGNEQILVGLTPGRIEKLHALANPIVVEDQGQAANQRFAEKFAQLMNSGKKEAESRNDS